MSRLEAAAMAAQGLLDVLLLWMVTVMGGKVEDHRWRLNLLERWRESWGTRR